MVRHARFGGRASQEAGCKIAVLDVGVQKSGPRACYADSATTPRGSKDPCPKYLIQIMGY